jgi:curved DNA-binding protein CbpA
MEDKRDFKRYICKIECKITLGEDTLHGFVVDYSDGLGVITGKNPLLQIGAHADISMIHTGEEFSGEVVWLKEVGADMRVGFKKVGNLKGNLANFKYVDLLIGLQRGTKTGTLEVVSGSTAKKIYIKHGDMIFAGSNLPDDRLGERLVKKGIISVEKFNLASQRLFDTREKLGKILVDMSCLTPRELYREVRNQVEDIILSIFSIEEGEFEFKEGSLSDENLVTLKISAANIIYRGIKRIKSYNYIKQIFPSPDDVLKISQEPINIFQSIHLGDTDKQILQSINGRDTLTEILSHSPENNFETLKTISAFLCIGLISIKRQHDEAAEIAACDILQEEGDKSPEEFLKAVDDLYTRCELAGYYDFLAINEKAGAEEIQRAYSSISKRFHPDRHFAFPALDIKSKLIKIFMYATEAHSVLSDPGNRDRYDSSLLPAGHGIQDEMSGESAAEAQEGLVCDDAPEIDVGDFGISNEQAVEDAIVSPFEMGISYMDMGLMEEAIEEFSMSLNLTEKRVQSSKLIAECYVRQGQNRKAIETIKELMEDLSPDNKDYMDMKYELADVYIKSNEREAALKLLDEIKSADAGFRDVASKIEAVKAL